MMGSTTGKRGTSRGKVLLGVEYITSWQPRENAWYGCWAPTVQLELLGYGARGVRGTGFGDSHPSLGDRQIPVARLGYCEKHWDYQPARYQQCY